MILWGHVARTNAGLTQEQLAKKIAGLSANDISLAERGKQDLTQDQLKKIAKATGVTQASLLNAAKGSTTNSTASKTSSSSSKTSVKVTATEKKLLELYRAAESETKNPYIGGIIMGIIACILTVTNTLTG